MARMRPPKVGVEPTFGAETTSGVDWTPGLALPTRLGVGEVPEQPVAVLTSDEQRLLLATCMGRSFEDRRDTAIFRVFIDTGARLAEVSGRLVANLHLDGRRRWRHAEVLSQAGTDPPVGGQGRRRAARRQVGGHQVPHDDLVVGVARQGLLGQRCGRPVVAGCHRRIDGDPMDLGDRGADGGALGLDPLAVLVR